MNNRNPLLMWALAAAGAGALLPDRAAEAALVLQAEMPVYSVATDGTTRTDVRIYLAETGSTTVLTNEGGINQFQINIAAGPSASAPTLVALIPNPAFSGNKIASLASGDMGGAFLDLTSGVQAVAGRVFLGTAQFTGSASVVETTYQISAPAAEFYNYTADGTDLYVAGPIVTGQFLVAVPEPASLGALAAGALLLVRRRRA